jgi:hypothetical protein
MKKKILNYVKSGLPRALAVTLCSLLSVAPMLADTSAGAGALQTVATEIKSYIEYVQTLIYAIAGVVTLVGAISVYIKMNNEEQDVKKSIMLIVGADIFLVAAAKSLPLFFE